MNRRTVSGPKSCVMARCSPPPPPLPALIAFILSYFNTFASTIILQGLAVRINTWYPQFAHSSIPLLSSFTMVNLTTPAGLESYLHDTVYSAAEIDVLSGGALGFVYRVVLKTPLPSGETSVIVKHGLNNAASDIGMTIRAERIVRAGSSIPT